MSDYVYKGEDFDDKVRKQVEFYFSDSNLQTDKFLWRIFEANDGWVELKTILTFGRMRQYRPEERVIEALKNSDKLVLSADGALIKRKDPLKDFNELRNIRKRNSVHVEGFPAKLSQEDLEEFFEGKIAPKLPKEKSIASIRRIRTKAKKEFFGTVDVEFKTQEDADYFIKELKICYPQGIVDENSEVEQKDELKKMSLLSFQELKEGGKRFGVNEVTKRRNSFNDSKGSLKQRKTLIDKKPKNGSGSGSDSGLDSGAVLEAAEDKQQEDNRDDAKDKESKESNGSSDNVKGNSDKEEIQG